MTRAGDSSAWSQVETTYTPVGDVATVNGPAWGVGDTSYMYYDAMRQLRVSVTPNNPGNSLPWRATRTTYDADGNPTRIQKGAVAAPGDCSAGNNFCNGMADILRSDTAYDGFGRKIREDLVDVGTGAPALVTQTSYDAAGRLDCVARRMNAAVYGPNLPGACTQSTAGAFGPDRIVRTLYNADGDVVAIQSGYGTSLARDERVMTYLQPGQLATLKDAKSNLTTYEYDGFNRLAKLRYPNTGVGSNSSSTTDYDEYGYDPAGNKLTERRRDGQVIVNYWDNLNRLRYVDRPGSELDITNDYDNLRLFKSSDSSTRFVSRTHDALGRLTGEYQSEINAGFSYQYDPGGHWTRLVWSDGFWVHYDVNDAGETITALENGAGGAGYLGYFSYDDVGRPRDISRPAVGGHTGITFDAASRLGAMGHSIATGGGANNAFVALSYNPAGQITSRSSTAAYNWPYSASFSDSYSVNGLNQYTSARGSNISYDGRGNTTNDGTKGYTYDSSNRLTSASNGAAAVYDPTGRLLSISLGGATTKFLYDGTRLIGEYNGSNQLLRRYVHGPGTDQPIVWYEGSGTGNRNWLYVDERGSIIGVEGPQAGGAGYKINKYDEYGQGDPSNLGRFSYTGQTWLSEVGLHYYKARVYNPTLGRFMQTDPIGTKDQVNLYGYVGNDPVNKVDPTGTTCETARSDQGATYATSCKIDEGRDELVKRIGEKRVASLEKQYLAAVNKLYSNKNSVRVAVNEIGADGKKTGGVKSADVSARDVADQLSSRTFKVDMNYNGLMKTNPIHNITTMGNEMPKFWDGVSIAGLSGATTSPELRLQVAITHEGIHGPSQGLYEMFDRQLGFKLYNKIQAEAWNDEHQDPYDRGAYDLLYKR